jgi:hypothetical protein
MLLYWPDEFISLFLPQIIPYADQIIQLLVPHWSDTSEPMLLNALVIAFTKIAFVSIHLYSIYICLFIHSFLCLIRFLMTSLLVFMTCYYRLFLSV